jgi:hypothetical protein
VKKKNNLYLQSYKSNCEEKKLIGILLLPSFF